MGLNGYLFPIPKNEMKASMIVHLVHLNKCHRFEPARFSLPSVEDLAFVIQAHSMGLPNLSLGTPCLGHLDDPFLRELDNLRLLADRGLSLLAYHINLTNAFWSLTLPEPYKNSFRVRIDGRSYAFSCLPFGWCLTSGSSRRTLPRTTMRFHGMENKIPNHCGTWSQASRGTGWTCGRWRR